jgi:hypothetical protein
LTIYFFKSQIPRGGGPDRGWIWLVHNFIIEIYIVAYEKPRP